ncbi:triose-phosphate isomerase [Pseudomonas sp. HMWF032]|uniref:triose-phosphate isomerase n=1 Tax=unclassified Pseudomonas TaxID=196821 RepID=UPI000D3BE0D7|nr:MULTISPECIES: triose-phosphate isomerase [unclassified Pseudomonas]PTS83070.1 triose-phosphate isomerase [Pseudomonas sp. HMWF032]PTT80159.1 triose-phosphate isomerase [Pseudomonas sp. HMWF010]WAC45122.1 triose-phosphate isomerase [Pseudomonas sp. SL4(2022)]
MRRPMVAGNWKMHGTRASVAELINGLTRQALPVGVDVVVFPSCVHIAQVVDGLAGKAVAVGAQNCATELQQGALTGEVASSQLADLRCSLVLVGHSERRLLLGESDEVVTRKFAVAQSSGLLPVLCVGETLAQREAGQTLEVVAAQLSAVTDALGVEVFSAAVIAYEPVWAIGTGLTASPAQAQEVHAAIRAQLAAKSPELAGKVRILYGGSVKAASAAELFGMPDIDGGLVGGASLNADEFGAICRAAGS